MMFENTLRYSTFADRSQVENRIESYETLMVPSNLLIGGKNAIPPLIHQLLDSGEIEFYIDPTVTEFHRGESFMDGAELKSWHQKLVKELGEPLLSIIDEEDNLVYTDLSQEERQDIAEAVCRLQEDFVDEAVREQMGKYEQALVEDISPRAVIPWYVKIEDYPDIRKNEEIISNSVSSCESPLKPCLHLDLDFLRDIEAHKAIAELANVHDNDEVFVWVDGFDKVTTEIDEYINVIRLVARLMDNDVRPHAMYGDFFSNLLMYFGLRGIGFGTYHQEDKEEKLEAGGGGNLQRYYFDPVKEFLSIPVAAELGQELDAAVPDHSGLIEWGRLYKLGEDHDFLKNHFIRTKNAHRQFTFNHDLEFVLQQLEEDYERFGEPLEKKGSTKTADHLRKWVRAIREYMDKYPEEAEAAIRQTEQEVATQGLRL